jgi:hypothetical protein
VRWSNTSAEKTEGASASVSTSAFTSVCLLEMTWQQAPFACMTLMYPYRPSRYRPHRPQESDRERKSCKPPGYCKVGMWSVLMTAVGNRSSVGGTITAIIRNKSLQIARLLLCGRCERYFAGSPSHQRCGRANAQTFSYGGIIQDGALSECGLSLVQASFIYVLKPGLAG